MKLVSFKVKSFTRKDSVAKLYKLGDWKMKHVERRKEYYFDIEAEDGTHYSYHCYRKPPLLYNGDKINVFISPYLHGDDNHKKIEYHSLYGTFLTERELQKAINDYVERHRKQIAWEQAEIERLEALR